MNQLIPLSSVEVCAVCEILSRKLIYFYSGIRFLRSTQSLEFSRIRRATSRSIFAAISFCLAGSRD